MILFCDGGVFGVLVLVAVQVCQMHHFHHFLAGNDQRIPPGNLTEL